MSNGDDVTDEEPGEREDAGDEERADAGHDERMGDGVEHLQSAAREMIAAARTFLDVVDDVVGDHAALTSLADALGSMGQAVVRAGGRAREAGTSAPGSAGHGDDDDDDDGGRVQHIEVS